MSKVLLHLSSNNFHQKRMATICSSKYENQEKIVMEESCLPVANSNCYKWSMVLSIIRRIHLFTYHAPLASMLILQVFSCHQSQNKM